MLFDCKRSVDRRLWQPEACSHLYQLRQRFGFHLSHRVATMLFDFDFTDADGSGQTILGKGLYPKPPDLRAAGTQNKSDGELYYTIA